MTTALPTGVTITYGVQFTDQSGDTVVATTDENREWFDSPAHAASHAMHLRLSGIRDAHVVHDLAGRIGWQPVHLIAADAGVLDVEVTDAAAKTIARVLGEHTAAALDDDTASSIAYFAVLLAEHLASSG